MLNFASIKNRFLNHPVIMIMKRHNETFLLVHTGQAKIQNLRIFIFQIIFRIFVKFFFQPDHAVFDHTRVV